MSRRILRKYDGKKQEWLHLAELLTLMLILAFLVFQFIFGISTVSGDSMEPSFNNGDVVLYYRLTGDYDYGKIVAVGMPSGELYIKRVVGRPGDVIEISSGSLIINGEAERGDYPIADTDAQDSSLKYPYTVEPGRYFVLGDNRPASVDSRTFGTVSEAQIKGVVLFRIRSGN